MCLSLSLPPEESGQVDANKVTKEKSRQTRSLRAFCLANASLCMACIIDWLSVGCSVILQVFAFLYNAFCKDLYNVPAPPALLCSGKASLSEQCKSLGNQTTEGTSWLIKFKIAEV